jgi:uncharacterized protein (UPF0276 family)
MTLTPHFKNCPTLGVGLGLRSEIFEETLAATDAIDWVEMTPENYMGRGGQALKRIEQVQTLYPIASHGVTMSVGSLDSPDEEYLSDLEALFAHINPPWFSDHLCFSGFGGSYSNDLLPLPFTKEAVQHVTARIRLLQDRFERPFLLENISYYLHQPQHEMPETVFFTEILERADCGLLLDVNNVYVNAQNHRFDAKDFLAKLPLERVVQLHVAGHNHYPDGIIDTHGEAVCPDVWELTRWTLEHCKPAAVLLERDLNIPPFEELLLELHRLRQLWNETQPIASPVRQSHQSLALSR